MAAKGWVCGAATGFWVRSNHSVSALWWGRCHCAHLSTHRLAPARPNVVVCKYFYSGSAEGDENVTGGEQVLTCNLGRAPGAGGEDLEARRPGDGGRRSLRFEASGV